MDGWKEKLRRQIDLVADEIKAGAYETITSSEKICSARIEIDLNPEEIPTVRYTIESLPRGYWQ